MPRPEFSTKSAIFSKEFNFSNKPKLEKLKIKKPHIILAIEAAIQGGSISIYAGENQIDFWVGEKAVSRAEDLLEAIYSLLKKNRINKKDIDLIGVSNLIGSQTGIRIGLSTALGLRKAFDCDVKVISILDALRPTTAEEKTIVALSNNKRDIYTRLIKQLSQNNIQEKNQFEVTKYEVFCELVDKEFPVSLIVNEILYEHIIQNSKIKTMNKISIFNAGKNLAKFLGEHVREINASDNI